MAAEAVTAACWIFSRLIFAELESVVAPLLIWTAAVEWSAVLVPELYAAAVEFVDELRWEVSWFDWLMAVISLVWLLLVSGVKVVELDVAGDE